MLHFIQSNKLEKLLGRLCEVRNASRLDPLEPIEIVVQNPGMGRWVSQQLAIREGIAANLKFPLPARFIWQVLAAQLKDIDAQGRDFDRRVLAWRIFDEISFLEHDKVFIDIQSYLLNDQDGRKKYHLATRIADLFDQYLVYRPNMLLQWEGSAEKGWQAALWNKLVTRSREHRARYFATFLLKAQQSSLNPDLFPQQVFLFGISSLAPVYLQVIEAISSHADVYLFHLSPCRDFWEDIVSEAEMARKLKNTAFGQNTADEYLLAGNPILASQGKLGREFASLIPESRSEEEWYEKPMGSSLLAALQGDILDLVDRTEAKAEKLIITREDRSVQLHSCHSKMREVQVLHDKLLEIFAEDPAIKPGDIIVMTPVIEEYAPAIRSVFEGAAGELFIPWSLADRSIRGEDPLAEAFLALFELCRSRFTASGVISFFETDAVLRRFGIDAEELGTIRRWIEESGIRWGLDQAHRQEFSSGMSEEHSWTFGLNRLLMGYFTGRDNEIVQGIAPLGALLGGFDEELGKFAQFLERLANTRELFKKEHSVAAWADLLLKLLEDFFDPGMNEREQQALVRLRETVCSMAEDVKVAGFDEKVQMPVIREYLHEALAQPSSGHAFLSGRVTFCNMVPMRSVPFAVVCLLGMNDNDYPRRQSTIGFDLMAHNPQIGDRNRRDDDRYLFLEALISARKTFYISWQGRNQIDNSSRPTSVVVAELVDYIGRSFINETGEALNNLVTAHPLQPFSRKCYDKTPEYWSFAPQWLPTATGQQEESFIAGSLPVPSEEMRQLDLQQLLRFWSHPVRYFLAQRLNMNMFDTDNMLEDSETFQPDNLQRYHLLDRFVRAGLEEDGKVLDFRQLQAEGLLPHGSFAQHFYNALVEEAGIIVPRIRPIISDPREALEVWLPVGDFNLSGWLHGLYDYGCIRFRSAKLKGKDLVRTWIEHLVYTILTGKQECRTLFMAKDVKAEFSPVANPNRELQNLLDLYWQGLSMPLQFFPETSWAWFNFGKDKRNSYQANQKWYGGFVGHGEGEDLAYRLALRGVAPLDEEFEQLSTAVLTPLSEHLELTDE